MATDGDGRITDWNPAAEHLFGYTAAQMRGRLMADLFPPHAQQEAQAAVAAALQGTASRSADVAILARSGASVGVDLTTSPIRDAAGHVVGVSHICRDNADRRQLASAALHLAAVVASADDAIISKDLQGTVESWNRAAEQLFGFTAAEMIGQSIRRIIPAERQGEEDQVLAKIGAGETIDHFETQRQTKDGRLVDISLTVSPIRDDTGRVIGASKIARDIREHKRLVEERRTAAANEDAARREVLEEQNRRIQEAARLKSEFVANMSHELRTPLNSIVGFAKLIADARFGPLPPRYQEFAQIMHTSAQHLLQLINDILDLAKVESGRIDLQPQSVDISRIVSEATAIVSGLAAKRNLTLTTFVDPACGLVHLDPVRLKQVIYNYLSNAIKFTPDGGRIALRVRPEGGDGFRVEVEDTGIGIRPEDEHRLFIEFQQLDTGPAKKVGGSGLGLALTKRLIEAQGGTVGVRSLPGAGSTFFATLPRYVTADAAVIAAPTAKEMR